MESTWSPDRVYIESIAQLSKYALSYVDSMWTPCGSIWTLVESMWSYGVHMESMGEGKVHQMAKELKGCGRD
jgi:hypothetical protein